MTSSIDQVVKTDANLGFFARPLEKVYFRNMTNRIRSGTNSQGRTKMHGSP